MFRRRRKESQTGWLPAPILKKTLATSATDLDRLLAIVEQSFSRKDFPRFTAIHLNGVDAGHE